MPLTNAEVYRIKTELGYNALTLGAVPYVSVYAIFDVVIKPYLEEGGDTTSSTSVVAVDAGAAAAPVALTLTSATGFTAGNLVWIDVDSRLEKATVQSITGSAITCLLEKEHSGSYPVTVDGGVAEVRECLRQIRKVRDNIGNLFTGVGAIKKADEVEFYQGAKGSAVQMAQEQLDFWRDQLASTIGLQNFNKPSQRGAGGRIAL